MESKLAVYQLEPVLDDPRYEGFGCKERGSFPKAIPAKRTSRNWQPIRLAPKWNPIAVVGRVRPFNDYPCVVNIPAFSQRAVDSLRDILEPNGEILPLSTPLGSYFAYNITTVADVLDWQHSDMTWHDNAKPVYALDIERFEFFMHKLENLTIFRLPEFASGVFVTQAFVSRVEASGLQGFNFIRVWPLPPGVIWWKLAKAQWENQQKAGLIGGKTVKGNTVVICLRLGTQGGKPGKAETDAINKLMDELDSILLDPKIASSYPGNLEGSDYGAAGECRLFLTCPDADALVQCLRPWLKSLHWPNGFSVVKRFSGFRDPDAREEVVKL